MEDTYKHLDNFVKEITCPVLWRIFFFIDLFLWKNSTSDEYKTFSASICNFNWRVGWQMSTAVKWWNPEGMLNSRQNELTKIFWNFFTQTFFLDSGATLFTCGPALFWADCWAECFFSVKTPARLFWPTQQLEWRQEFYDFLKNERSKAIS